MENSYGMNSNIKRNSKYDGDASQFKLPWQPRNDTRRLRNENLNYPASSYNGANSEERYGTRCHMSYQLVIEISDDSDEEIVQPKKPKIETNQPSEVANIPIYVQRKEMGCQTDYLTEISDDSDEVGQFNKPKEECEKPLVPECPVCFETLFQGKSIMATVCGHLFCEGCIRDEIEKRKQCPICRKRLYKRGLLPLYC